MKNWWKNLTEKTTDMLIKEMFKFHGLLLSIVLNKKPQFVSMLWDIFYKKLGIQINFSTIYHFEIDKQIERIT